MELAEISNVSELDCCPSSPFDLPEDMDLSCPSWSDSMFSGPDDEIIEASELFGCGLSSSEGFKPQGSTSSSSSSSVSVSSSSIAPPASFSVLLASPNAPPPADKSQSSPNGDSPYSPEPPLSDLGEGGSCTPKTPSPAVEENCWVKSEIVDYVPQQLDCFSAPEELLEQADSPLLDALGLDSNCGDNLECHELHEGYMDELLQLEAQALGGLGLPSLQNAFSGADGEVVARSKGACPSVSSSGLPLSSLPQELSETPEGSSENLSQVFVQWVKNNADCFSLSDLKKIKLKTSTIESATRRLGGGQKGMVYLLKLILIWIQNHHLERRRHQTPISEQRIAGLDDRSMNDYLCTPILENGNTNEDNFLTVFLDDTCKDESGSPDLMSNRNDQDLGSIFIGGENECGTPGNLGAMQQMSEDSFGLNPKSSLYNSSLYQSVAPSHDSYSSLHSIGPSKFRPIATDDSSHMGFFNARHSPGSSYPVGFKPSLHVDHTYPASSFSLLGRPSSEDKVWQSAMGQPNLLGVSLQERNYQPFSGTGLSAECGAFMPVGDLLNIRPNTPAATTRAARKSRMARQRWSIRHSRNQLAWSSHVSGSTLMNMPQHLKNSHRLGTSGAETRQGRKAGKNLKLVLQKELKQSDVGSLGRIVLPKKEAETNLPYLPMRDGINIVVEDFSSSKVWNMRYRFWPNNKSRMYLLENAGDFVKFHHLKEGDFMSLYYDASSGKYMIRGFKVSQSEALNKVAEKNPSMITIIPTTGTLKSNRTVSGGEKPVDMSGSNEGSPTNGSSSEPSSSVSEPIDSGDDVLLEELRKRLPDDP